MAVITPTVTRITPGVDAWLITWASIGDSDTCTAVAMPEGNEKSVQISGTFNSATIVFQGSNNGSDYATLTDPQGNAISKTAAAIEAVSEHTRYIKPATSGGTSSAVTVTVLVKGQTR